MSVADQSVGIEILDFLKSKLEIPNNIQKLVLTIDVDCLLQLEIKYIPEAKAAND